MDESNHSLSSELLPPCSLPLAWLRADMAARLSDGRSNRIRSAWRPERRRAGRRHLLGRRPMDAPSRGAQG